MALIDRHGDQAAIHAALNADAMLEAGDLHGAAQASPRCDGNLLPAKPENLTGLTAASQGR
jgi:hypothetical protein